MWAHDLAAETSRALHQAVADRLSEDPALLGGARERVAGWLRDGTVARPYAEHWDRLLAAQLPEILAALTERSERMHDLRQVSPFAGVVSARERWRIRDTVKIEFAREARRA